MKTIRGGGLALALHGTEDAGRSDAATLARGARRLRVRTTQLAPPVRAVDLSDDEEPGTPTLDVLTDAVANARGTAATLRSLAALMLHAASEAAMTAEALEMDGQADVAGALDTILAAGTVATAAARKVGAL